MFSLTHFMEGFAVLFSPSAKKPAPSSVLWNMMPAFSLSLQLKIAEVALLVGVAAVTVKPAAERAGGPELAVAALGALEPEGHDLDVSAVNA